MRAVRKIKKFIKLIGSIFYLYYYRIKNIGKPKNIAQVVDSFNSGGLEQVAANIYKTFEENGNGSFVITLNNNLGPICQQMKSPAHLRIVYYDLSEMIKFCAKNNIRTLIYHFTTFKMPQMHLLGMKNYYIIHNTYIWYTQKEWKHLKFKLKFTKGIISVSEWCKDYFIKKTGIKNIKVILNGINFDNLKQGNISSITRKNMKLKEKDIACLTIGSYTDGKHQMKIIGIAEEIIKVNKNIKFICAGPVINPELYNLFLKKVKKSKARNNIIILDYIPQDEIGSFIKNNCDIYLQPSIHEAGVPLTVMESLLSGKPVIMTDFMLDKTFPITERIFGIKTPYKDILEVTPENARNMARKSIDRTTNDYVKQILALAENIDKFKDNFNEKDYEFLSVKRMGREYIETIKL